MIKTVDTIRMRLLTIVIALGLVVPIVPAAGDDCGSCARSEAERCDTAVESIDSCCSAEEEPAEDEAGDHDCCDCACCGTAMTSPVMHRSVPPRVSIMPSTSAVVWLAALSPQDAAGELLRPPQA